jgi:WD40 repeat protein
VGKWIRLIGAGLLGLLGACRPFGSQTLPDSRFSSADFTPDGGRILVNSRLSDQVYLYDLVAKDFVWRKPAQAISGVSFSPGGKFAIFVDQTPNDARAQLSVIRLSDGTKRAFARRFGDGNPDGLDTYYCKQAGQLTAVSDDGAWVTLAYSGAPMEVYSAADGRMVYQGARKDMRVDQVSLDPSNKQLAVRWVGPNEPSVQILTLAGGTWSETAIVKNVLRYAWTSAGLAIVTPRGIELWSGGEPRLVVPLVQRRNEHNAYALVGDNIPSVNFAPDGAFAVVSRYNQFDVFDLKSGAKIFSHGEQADFMRSSDGGLVRRGEFVGKHLRALLQTGNFVDVDLSIPQIVKTISFGSPGHYSSNWFTDGSSWVSSYQSRLAPGGRYVDIFEENADHRVYPLP